MKNGIVKFSERNILINFKYRKFYMDHYMERKKPFTYDSIRYQAFNLMVLLLVF